MVNVDDLDDELCGLIKPELAPGERLLWAARGTPRYGAPGWVWACIWALGFGGICILLFSLSIQPRFRAFENALVFFGLFAGIIGFFVAIAAIQSGFAWGFEGRSLRKAVYALTDQRVILWRPQPHSKGIEVVSHVKGRFSSVRRVEYPGGTGDIWIEGAPNVEFGSYSAGIQGVPDVRRVEEMVRRVLLDSE